MNRLEHKNKTSALRAHRVRARAQGTTERPRLSVNITNLHISAQIINDQEHVTLAAVSTVGQKTAKGTMTERASWVGVQIATIAKTKKITQVVFDRGDRKYHGRIKALADAARAGGLSF